MLTLSYSSIYVTDMKTIHKQMIVVYFPVDSLLWLFQGFHLEPIQRGSMELLYPKVSYRNRKIVLIVLVSKAVIQKSRSSVDQSGESL